MELYVILVIVVILVLIVTAIIVAVFVSRPKIIPLTPIVPVTPTATQPPSTIPVTDISDGSDGCKPKHKRHSSTSSSASFTVDEEAPAVPERHSKTVVSEDDYTLSGTPPATRHSSSSSSTTDNDDHTLGDTPTPSPSPRHHHRPKKVNALRQANDDISDFTGGASHQLRIYTNGKWRTIPLDIEIEKLQHSGVRLYALSNNVIYRLDDKGKITPYIGKGKFPFDGYIDDFYVRDGGMFIKSGDDYYKLMSDGLEACNIFPDAILHEICDKTVYSYHDDGSLTLDGVEMTTNFECPLDTTQALQYYNSYLYYVTSDEQLCRSKVEDDQLGDTEVIVSNVKLYTLYKGEYAYINSNDRLYINDEHIGSAATAHTLCMYDGCLYVA